jgi:hypothetical protein
MMGVTMLRLGYRLCLYAAAFVAGVYLISFLDQSYVVISNRGLAVPNEAGAVRAAALQPAAINSDLGPYSASQYLGVHFVAWSGWHRGGRYVLIPGWLASLVAAICLATALLAAWHERRHRLRMRSGRCPACGYDLRATPERCPECGTAADRAAAATAV